MKKLLCTMVVSTFLISTAIAENKAENSSNKGIMFQKGTWEEVLDLAKKKNKLIFLDIYTTWCGPCKMLKNKTFPDSSVGSFFNANFISYAIDAESKDGAEVAKKYKIAGYPTLLFVNRNGDIVHETLGFHSPKELLELGKEVQLKNMREKVKH